MFVVVKIFVEFFREEIRLGVIGGGDAVGVGSFIG